LLYLQQSLFFAGENGKVTVLAGPKGSGKSTWIDVLQLKGHKLVRVSAQQHQNLENWIVKEYGCDEKLKDTYFLLDLFSLIENNELNVFDRKKMKIASAVWRTLKRFTVVVVSHFLSTNEGDEKKAPLFLFRW
jgi:ABC-type uncharacterized transport system ATPase subunit